jgi:hypothetical protein
VAASTRCEKVGAHAPSDADRAQLLQDLHKDRTLEKLSDNMVVLTAIVQEMNRNLVSGHKRIEARLEGRGRREPLLS